MAGVLKGNFATQKKVEIEVKGQETLEERFEREALKKIGGSIAFVSKQKVAWDFDEEK